MPQHAEKLRTGLSAHLPPRSEEDRQLKQGPIARVLELQRLVGNQASAALVQRCGGQVHAGCNCAADRVARMLVQRDGNDDDKQKPPPIVGQDRAVDPGDKGAGISGTWDTSGPKSSPRVTGAYADPPFNAHGDPFTYDSSGSNSSGNNQAGPTGMDALCGPGKQWAQNGNSGGCVAPTAPETQVDGGMTVPQPPAPEPVVTWGTPDMYQQQPPAPDSNTQPGDYPTPSPDDDKQTA
jgi:hypothetical protein